jgi:hypothetical protein
MRELFCSETRPTAILSPESFNPRLGGIAPSALSADAGESLLRFSSGNTLHFTQ